ncbi:hypothetical protein C2845_PM05G11550 [Panicum miliaceum]|uniref:Uncharacterized protein n=1 Tax=Panicum miliaceum TaxID=4540 RepID=A0A3L6SU74_PANMI|nr:hypothetical protein C2845_PM05G11550 [Panicum miliaceum]
MHISDPKLPNIMVNDPLDDENPRSETANSIHDSKREQIFRVVSSHDRYTTTVFDFVQTDGTATESSRRLRLQGQASAAAPA